MATKTIKPSNAARTVLEQSIRDCYTATVQSAQDDGFNLEQAHASAWRNLLDTYPRISTGDLAHTVNDLVES